MIKLRKKILYISNIEVPYRTAFFNGIAKEYDLTVLYERSESKNRNKEWSLSEKSNYLTYYLNGVNIKKESSFSFKINKYLLGNYDIIILGCCNTPVEIYSKYFLKLHKREYYINIDGDYDMNANTFKGWLKRMIFKGAKGYFVAGNVCAKKVKEALKTNNVYPYPFSSLTKKDIILNKKNYENNNKEDFILVVGQFENYKGLDIALEVAKKMPNQKFKFIGMNNKSLKFKSLIDKRKIKNVEIIAFLNKDDLKEEYKKCKLFVLPSRKECWGLVINEAASYGTPIVATRGAGAAVELLNGKYDFFLAESNNINSLYDKVLAALNYNDILNYKKYLIDKSSEYNIESTIKVFLKYLR